MTKAIDIKTAMNFLIVFDNAESNFEQSQAETFAERFPEIRKACQHIVKHVGKSVKKERDAKLRELGLAYVVNDAAKRDIIAAYVTIAGKQGTAIGKAAKAGKLGKCSTIRGAVASFNRANKTTPPKQRAPKSGQGKTKQVSFVANGKKPVTLADKLAALEAFAESQGFSFTDFVAEWTDEVEAGDTGKKAANG